MEDLSQEQDSNDLDQEKRILWTTLHEIDELNASHYKHKLNGQPQ